jgi:predicted peptidase
VVAPQVPPNGRWTADLPVDQSAFNNEELTTLAILDSLAVEFNIDPNRVYVTGLSLGGHGTWDFVSRLPHRFAAAVPMSGLSDPTQADEILHLPIWAFHGESDTVVPASGSRGIIYAMENLGRDVLYTECRRSLPLAKNFDCPGTISLDSLAEAIDDHADLIFTSVRNGGHGPWNVWYDHPLLADWLFSKYRVNPYAITIDQPSKIAVW